MSDNAKKHIEDSSNQCFVSLVSLWEMAIKVSLGKLDLQGDFETVLEDILNNGFELQPITFDHILQQTYLDWHHKDPFDRLLVAQCLFEKMPIISRDSMLDDYFKSTNLKRIW